MHIIRIYHLLFLLESVTMFDEVTIYPDQIEDTKMSDVVRAILDFWDKEELCEQRNQNYIAGIWSQRNGESNG